MGLFKSLGLGGKKKPVEKPASGVFVEEKEAESKITVKGMLVDWEYKPKPKAEVAEIVAEVGQKVRQEGHEKALSAMRSGMRK